LVVVRLSHVRRITSRRQRQLVPLPRHTHTPLSLKGLSQKKKREISNLLIRRSLSAKYFYLTLPGLELSGVGCIHHPPGCFPRFLAQPPQFVLRCGVPRAIRHHQPPRLRCSGLPCPPANSTHPTWRTAPGARVFFDNNGPRPLTGCTARTVEAFAAGKEVRGASRRRAERRRILLGLEQSHCLDFGSIPPPAGPQNGRRFAFCFRTQQATELPGRATVILRSKTSLLGTSQVLSDRAETPTQPGPNSFRSHRRAFAVLPLSIPTPPAPAPNPT
jgi:hypothetical protein